MSILSRYILLLKLQLKTSTQWKPLHNTFIMWRVNSPMGFAICDHWFAIIASLGNTWKGIFYSHDMDYRWELASSSSRSTRSTPYDMTSSNHWLLYYTFTPHSFSMDPVFFLMLKGLRVKKAPWFHHLKTSHALKIVKPTIFRECNYLSHWVHYWEWVTHACTHPTPFLPMRVYVISY